MSDNLQAEYAAYVKEEVDAQRFVLSYGRWLASRSGLEADVDSAILRMAAAAATTPEVDDRVLAFEAIAKHPFFQSCYGEDRPLLESMLAKLNGVSP